MNDEEKDVYIRGKIKDGYIPEKIDNLFNNSTQIIENKGEKRMEENLNMNQNQEQNQNNQNKPEKKKMPVAAKRVLATAACLTVLLGGGNIYASTQGYDNIFFLIGEKLGISKDVFGKDEILSDRDITISYKPIEIAKGTQIQVNSLVIKDNEAKLKMQVNESNLEDSITPLKYVVKDENGTELYSDLSNTSSTVLYGDVNCDGKVNTKDLVRLQKYLGEMSEDVLTVEGKINADVNLDGNVDAEDRIILMKHLSKEEEYETLPYRGEVATYGDVNCDGQINEEDSNFLLNYLAGNEELSEQGKINADVYADGILNGRDAVAIMHYLDNWEGYETLPYIPETSEESVQYKEELILNGFKEDTKKLTLEIYDCNTNKIVDLEIDLENKEINVIGNAEEVTKISEEELKQYLGAFATLSYKGTEYNRDFGKNAVEVENARKILTAVQIAEINNIDLYTGDKEYYDIGYNKVLDREKVNKMVESFTEIQFGEPEEKEEMQLDLEYWFYVSIVNNKVQYVDSAWEVGFEPTCLEVTDISYVNGIYNVTFKFCYSTEENKSFGAAITVEDLPVYEMSMGLILDENNEYSKYRVSTMSEAVLVEEGKTDNTNISEENTTDEQVTKTIQGFLNIYSSNYSSAVGMLTIEEIGLATQEELRSIWNTAEKDNEGYRKTNIKYSDLKNKMLEYMTEQVFEKCDTGYKDVGDVLWLSDCGASGYSDKVESIKQISSSENVIIYEVAISTEAFDGRPENRNEKFELTKNENGKYVVSAWGDLIESREKAKQQLQNYLDLLDAYQSTPAYLLYKLDLITEENFNTILGNNGYYTTVVKFSDYKEAMLSYVSESLFNEKFATLYNKTNDENGYLQFEHLGTSVGTNEVENITIKGDLFGSTYIAKVCPIYSDGVKGDAYNIEFSLETFMENNNKKTVISYCDTPQY